MTSLKNRIPVPSQRPKGLPRFNSQLSDFGFAEFFFLHPAEKSQAKGITGHIPVVDNLADDFWVFCSRLRFGAYPTWGIKLDDLMISDATVLLYAISTRLVKICFYL